MLAGHYAPALAIKALRPQTPLWVLFVGCELIDFAWSAFIVLGVEHASLVPGFTQSNDLDLSFGPYSHSLPAVFAWAAVFGLLVGFGLKDRVTGLLAAVAVLSHWVGDLVVHVPDLPLLWDPGPKVGFGLWHYRFAAFGLELALVVGTGAWWIQATGYKPKKLTLVVTLAVVAVSAYFGPVPPTIEGLGAAGFVLYTALAVFAWFADSNSDRVGNGREPEAVRQ